MNRRNFFRNLAIGTAALPAVAKVAMEPPMVSAESGPWFVIDRVEGIPKEIRIRGTDGIWYEMDKFPLHLTQ